MGPLAYALWISLAVVTQLMLALWGILSRYLQTKPDAPAPTLRLVLVISMMAEATMLLFHTLPTAALGCYQQRQRQQEQAAAAGGDQSAAAWRGPEGDASTSGSGGSAQSFGRGEQSMHSEASGDTGTGASCQGIELCLAGAVQGAVAAGGATEMLLVASHQQREQQGLPVWHSAAKPPAGGDEVQADYAGTLTAAVQGQELAACCEPGRPDALPPAAGAGAAGAAVQLGVAPAATPGSCRSCCSAQLPGDAAGLAPSMPLAPTGSQQPDRQGGSCQPACTGRCNCCIRKASQAGLPMCCSRSSCSSYSATAGSRRLRSLLRRQKSSVRPEVPLRRGLSSRFEELQSSRPRLYRFAALATLTVSFSATCGLQLCAPGFVDPSLVQLVGQFTAIGTAMAQALLLRHHLPWTIWPCAAVMTGGAAMVIVPSLGENEEGGLDSAEGWLGFGLAVAALTFTVVYFITLQATRHLGWSSNTLQHYFLTFSILLFLALSLPIDGAGNWGQQFAGWTAGDWAILAFESSLAYVGSAAAMQHCVWKLGAPMVSMFFGLRLVFTVALTKPVLGTSVIKTWVQVCGVIVTAGSVTAYVGTQWWASRKASLRQQGQQQAAAK